MILLLALIVSILVSLVRGGRFRWLAQVSFRLGWLAILAFALQWSIIYAPLPRTEGLLGPRTLQLMATYVLVAVVVIVNRRVPGLPLIGIGLGLNLLVMLANGGFMPVTMEAVERAGLTHLALGAEPGARLMATKDIILPIEATRLWVLSDIFVIPAALPFSTVFSPGDIFLAAGVFVLFQCAMRPQGTSERQDEQIELEASTLER